MFETLKPGQEMSYKFGAMAAEDRNILKQLRLNFGESIYVTFVDATGVSFYITRSPGNIEGFMPAGGVGFSNWSSFFEPVNNVNASYAESKHATKIFPSDFL